MLTAIVDMFFGDAGKGKLCDALASQNDIVVRFNGGPNAGHTVNLKGKNYKFHQLPCGGLADNRPVLVLADGMVLNPVSLLQELQQLDDKVIYTPAKLLISSKAHVIMPWHVNLDIRKSKKELGTTAQGVGPCYAEKANRKNAIRMGELRDRILSEKEGRYFAADILMNGPDKWQSYANASFFLEPYVTDTGKFLRKAVSEGANIVFEGANSIGLDIDHGNYPYVTSSGCGPAAIPQYCGLPNVKLDRIIGVFKCYGTRVGTGPMATEIPSAELAEKIRSLGGEYGTTTGRPRRIGWLNLDEIKENIELTATTELAITHCDTIAKLKAGGVDHICVQCHGRLLDVPTWSEPNMDNSDFKAFVIIVEEFLNVPVTILGIGQDRDAILFRTTEKAGSAQI